MYRRTLPLQPDKGAGVMIRALGKFRRNDANQGEGTRYLYMAGPSSWEVVDITEDRCGRKPSPLISA
jgi:hypothetical protein